MPFLIQWESKGVYTKYWGELTREEFMEASEAKRLDPRTSICEYSINDFLEVKSIDITKYDVLLLAHKDYVTEAIKRSNKIAHVIDNEKLKELSHTYEVSPLIKDTFKVKMFSTLGGARAWINA